MEVIELARVFLYLGRGEEVFLNEADFSTPSNVLPDSCTKR
jgi:hypothetical protein